MPKKIDLLVLLLAVVTLGSCNGIDSQPGEGVIARVNDHYLYEEDIASLVSENTTAEDSTLLVRNYINRWATQKLLIQGARINLTESQLKEFDQLVQNYKNELYAKAYTDAIVARELDTTIAEEAAQSYYEENGEICVLNEDLVKLRYINLGRNNSDLEEIKTLFRRFNQKDQEKLLEKSIHFNSYSLNDSVWVKTKEVYDKIGPLTPEDRERFLKNNNFLQLEDSLGVYLIQVKEVRLQNQKAPFEYALPSIEEILLNKRKLELIKKLEQDITQDAIKNNEFEIYD